MHSPRLLQVYLQAAEQLGPVVRFSTYIPVACLTSEKRQWIISGYKILSALDNSDLTDAVVKRTC